MTTKAELDQYAKGMLETAEFILSRPAWHGVIRQAMKAHPGDTSDASFEVARLIGAKFGKDEE